MVRADFDRNLNDLQQNLQDLGTMVEQAILKSMKALTSRDLQASFEVVQEDEQINKKRFELEEECIDLIATQQPLAIDLRTLLAVMHVAVELERMGDYAEGIGKISLMIGEEPLVEPLEGIPEMAEIAIDMLRRSMTALMDRDTDAAEEVWHKDDEVDSLYDQICLDLFTGMSHQPGTIERATHMLWVAHDLERMADRATNIAERVIYMVTGKMNPSEQLEG